MYKWPISDLGTFALISAMLHNAEQMTVQSSQVEIRVVESELLVYMVKEDSS